MQHIEFTRKKYMFSNFKLVALKRSYLFQQGESFTSQPVVIHVVIVIIRMCSTYMGSVAEISKCKPFRRGYSLKRVD